MQFCHSFKLPEGYGIGIPDSEHLAAIAVGEFGYPNLTNLF